MRTVDTDLLVYRTDVCGCRIVDDQRFARSRTVGRPAAGALVAVAHWFLNLRSRAMSYFLSWSKTKILRPRARRSEELFRRKIFMRRAADFGTLISTFLSRGWSDIDARCIDVTAETRRIGRHWFHSDPFGFSAAGKKLLGSDTRVRVVGLVVSTGLT